MKLVITSFVFLATIFLIFHNQRSEKQDQNGGSLNLKPLVFDDPELIEGLEIKSFNNRRFIQLKEGAMNGLAEIYFFDKTAKYNITLFYLDEPKGKSAVNVIINGQTVGEIKFDAEKVEGRRRYSLVQKSIPGINIQKWSKISLQFTGNLNEKCSIEKLVFTPVGAFDGDVEKLIKPASLKVFENTAEKLKGREMLLDFVNSRIDSLMEYRVDALSNFKTPREWEEQQDKTREQLEKFFGKFPERTPLNAKITGKIDHEKYTIEKIYFESQPRYYVTANLYTPKNRRGPLPAVLFTSGHSRDAKSSVLYHQACLGLVLKGYVVLAIDPMGQGERIEYFNATTKEARIEGAVSQHYYLGRPSFLVNQTFSGLRTWDCIRALDYLVSRPEVDTTKLAAVGNSGGGQMALLITAVDKRIKVCAAGHPGGEMEKNYLRGQNLIDRQILSLIAPRPVRIIVGDRSGEEIPHRKKIKDIQLFNEGLGYNKNRAQLLLVDGVHNLKLSKREAVYEWLNKWFGKEEEGSLEPALQPEDPKDLWVTESGFTLNSLGGETGQTLNAKRLKKIYKPVSDGDKLKRRIAKRIGLSTDTKNLELKTQVIDTVQYGDISVEKLIYQSEEGISIPSLLIKPKNIKPSSSIYIYASERGKPRRFKDSEVPFLLAKKGFIVLAIDVRGIGETSPTPRLPLPIKYSTRISLQWVKDCLAIQSPGFGRTMLAMRTFDVMRGIDFLKSRQGLKEKKVVLYGKGLGGLWTTLASIYDSRVEGVVTEGTLSSYRQLVDNKYYAVSSDYFWVPGALCDFDIPDLARLIAPKPQVWINPINGLGEKLSLPGATSIIGSHKNMHITVPDNKLSIGLSNLVNPNDKE